MDSNKIITKVKHSLESVIDPELGISVVRLELIRDIAYIPETEFETSEVQVTMTLTSPLCPFADAIIEDVENVVSLLGHGDCKVTITFNPPWEASEELRMMLGL
jgi:metal-sulfur cluster biosynthetic enzyme